MNWFALTLATLCPLIIGFLWYHPKVLGTVNLKTMEKSINDTKKGHPALVYGLALVLSLFLAYHLQMFVVHGGEESVTFKHGLYHGAIMGGMIILPALAIHLLFEGRRIPNILIHVAYWIVTVALMGGILSAWR